MLTRRRCRRSRVLAVQPSLPGAVVTGLTAIVGVVVGHAAAYVIAYPDAVRRGQVLHQTGHTYGDLARLAAIAAAASAGLAASVRGLRRGLLGRVPPARLVSFSRLAPLQLLAFCALEISERVASGTPISELAHGHELALGLLIQVGVAAAATALLALTERATARIAATLVDRRRHPTVIGLRFLEAVADPTGIRWWSAPYSRGPPSADVHSV